MCDPSAPLRAHHATQAPANGPSSRRNGGADAYVTGAGAAREFSTEPVQPNVTISRTLRLPKGIYDFEVEVIAYANTYVDYPVVDGEARFTITLTVAP